VGLAPTGKRRLVTAHADFGHWVARETKSLASLEDLIAAADGSSRPPSPVEQRRELVPQALPCFKTDAGDLRRGRDTFGDDGVVGVAGEGLETKRVDLGAPEPKRGHDVQAEEMAAVRARTQSAASPDSPISEGSVGNRAARSSEPDRREGCRDRGASRRVGRADLPPPRRTGLAGGDRRDLDGEPHLFVHGPVVIFLANGLLDRNGALHGIDRAGEIGDDAVSGAC
jgi:hypothetical protein